MEPKVWGKYLWTSIHLVALGYPDNPTDEEKSNYREFYRNIWRVLPCYKCAQNYQRHWDELPIDPYMKDNMTLFEWTVKLHNIVNKQLGKREWSFEEAKDKFSRVAKGQDDTFVCVDGAWDKIIRICTMVMMVLVLLLLSYWGYHFIKRNQGKKY